MTPVEGSNLVVVWGQFLGVVLPVDGFFVDFVLSGECFGSRVFNFERF